MDNLVKPTSRYKLHKERPQPLSKALHSLRGTCWGPKMSIKGSQSRPKQKHFGRFCCQVDVLLGSTLRYAKQPRLKVYAQSAGPERLKNSPVKAFKEAFEAKRGRTKRTPGLLFLRHSVICEAPEPKIRNKVGGIT